MWGSSNELKLRKAEREKSRMESMVLKDEKGWIKVEKLQKEVIQRQK